MPNSQTVEVDDKQRCAWCHGDDLYRQYHDEEWGASEHDPQALFERLILEGMQAGLAWITILRKRESMRSAFYNFDMAKLAASGPADVERWLQDAGIIRHRGKIEAMIGNAQLALAEEDFSAMLWGFKPVVQKTHQSLKSVPSQTVESQAMSKALKKKGYRFVGPTICYAFMQSVGMVNDHIETCWRFDACESKLND